MDPEIQKKFEALDIWNEIFQIFSDTKFIKEIAEKALSYQEKTGCTDDVLFGVYERALHDIVFYAKGILENDNE